MTALLAGLAAAFTLTACGVPPSDVIQAGEPASGMFSPSPKPSVPVVVSLYFLDDGDLTAYPRKIGDPADLGTVVARLFGGPTTSETVTATTELPRLTDTPDVTAGSGNGVSIKLPNHVAPLSHPAMLQLACTVAHVSGSYAALPADAHRDGAPAAPPVHAQRSPAHTSVHVLGDGWTMTQSADSCPDPPQP
ncbi:hypothetical protein [Streptomyces sp. HG99]|uniref:hypothetical protein n=1 Tax=Streptomyces sp. HG99 TaxID=1958787 RepID=UPI00211E1C4C|nr:hypothetical protein [Streptomyces sp. HG99]